MIHWPVFPVPVEQTDAGGCIRCAAYRRGIERAEGREDVRVVTSYRTGLERHLADISHEAGP
ncbi:hypothetical protein CTZ27_09735 [Streptomyces griseocarneus]|nr:hypothetical protein CTZ27_09735 [Streptomyces griseocarneus]